MAKDRLYINKNYRSLINEMKENDILGFESAETKEIYLIAVSLGVLSPTTIQNRDGFVRTSYLKTYERAMLSSLLLSKSKNDDEIDQYADLDKNIDYSESCAESGFKLLEDLYKNAPNPELLSKRLFTQLELLYQKNVVIR